MANPEVKAKVTELFRWLEKNQPHVYKGLIKRFTAPQTMSGLSDILSNAVNSVSNFVSSQGFGSVLTAAAPFLANRVQSQQLSMQIKALQAGVPLTNTSAAVAPGATAGAGTAMDPHALPQSWWDKIPTAGKIAGIGLLGVIAAYMMGGLGRGHNRRA